MAEVHAIDLAVLDAHVYACVTPAAFLATFLCALARADRVAAHRLADVEGQRLSAYTVFEADLAVLLGFSSTPCAFKAFVYRWPDEEVLTNDLDQILTHTLLD
jgi:hypothetical protein